MDQRIDDAGAVLADSPDAAWQMVFLDAERPHYVGYWPDLDRVLAPGALLAVDNCTSHAEEVAEFRALIDADARYESVPVPVGAGVLLVVKQD